MGVDLELVPTSELVAEVFSRCDVAELAMLRFSVNGQGRHHRDHYWKGNEYARIGLCMESCRDIQRELRQSQTELEEGDMN